MIDLCFVDISPVLFDCLQDINTYLEDKVYFVGHQLSLADFLLYYGLHNLFVSTVKCTIEVNMYSLILVVLSGKQSCSI